jgi:hypothetical protein
MSYPVTFEADFAERRSRLTTFFRLILLIPLVIVAYIYGIIAFAALIISWFAIVITGQFPLSLYDFIAGYTRFITRVTSYGTLMCDPYPSFWGNDDPEYPIRMQFTRLDRYSRLRTLFRIILAIPIVLIRYVMTLLLEIASVFAWFIIVIMGRLPQGLFEMMVLANSYIARSDAYIYLLTETYPPFQDEQTRAAGEQPPPVSPSGGPPSPMPSSGEQPPPMPPSGEQPPPMPPSGEQPLPG